MNDTKSQAFFATTPKGLELLLVDELRALGAESASEKLAGVSFKGDLAMAYKACLWSRLANRILLPLAEVPAATPEALYEGVKTIVWDQHLDPSSTLAVHLVSSQSQITHTLYGAQKVKDAIVDQLRDKYGERPNVSRERPSISVHVYLYRDKATISLDLSGESLHRRNYRLGGGAAPLKENLAAAVLIRGGWPAIAKAGGTLLDPMCGSGTLLIEAAFMAADRAPGLGREYYGFLGWKQHQAALWQTLEDEARQRFLQGIKQDLPTIVGYDQDSSVVAIAIENIERAGFKGKIHVERRSLAQFEPNPKDQPGLVVTNPPYGERLGEEDDLQPLYTLLGERLKNHFTGWKAAVFTGNPNLGKEMGVRARHYYALFNGPIPCKLLLFDLEAASFVDRSPEANNERLIKAAQKASASFDQESLEMFVNRLEKNFKHWKKQLKKQAKTEKKSETQILIEREDAYRIYDADLPEYAFAIDLEKENVRVQEYQAPRSVDPQKALRRRQEMLSVLPGILEAEPARVYFAVIQKQRKHS